MKNSGAQALDLRNFLIRNLFAWGLNDKYQDRWIEYYRLHVEYMEGHYVPNIDRPSIQVQLSNIFS